MAVDYRMAAGTALAPRPPRPILGEGESAAEALPLVSWPAAWKDGHFVYAESPLSQDWERGGGVRANTAPVTILPAAVLDPARLVLPDGSTPDVDAWPRHGAREDEVALLAMLPAGDRRLVCGELTLGLRPGRRGSIDRVYVAPECRRLGLGTALVRAALRHARAVGLAALDEYIPNLYALAGGGWARYQPVGAELGGVRSLGATARACAAERQVCRVARIALAWHTGERGDEGRVGAALEMPLAAPPAPWHTGPALLARLEAAIWRMTRYEC